MERPVTPQFFREFSLEVRRQLREIGMMEGDRLIYTREGGFRYGRTLESLHGLPKRVSSATIDAITSVVWFQPTSEVMRRELLSKFSA